MKELLKSAEIDFNINKYIFLANKWSSLVNFVSYYFPLFFLFSFSFCGTNWRSFLLVPIGALVEETCPHSPCTFLEYQYIESFQYLFMDKLTYKLKH